MGKAEDTGFGLAPDTALTRLKVAHLIERFGGKERQRKLADIMEQASGIGQIRIVRVDLLR
jgi:hypothetical protein